MTHTAQHCRAIDQLADLRRESQRLINMNKAYGRMLNAALAKDYAAFEQARQEFQGLKPC